jgi:hypothetical protein
MLGRGSITDTGSARSPIAADIQQAIDHGAQWVTT